MPTLVLSARYSDDSNSLWRAALAAGWDVERILRPDGVEALRGRDMVVYGETILGDRLIDACGVTLLEPAMDFLPNLPERLRKREVSLSTLGAARRLREPAFVKPVDEKFFPACVYPAGADVDAVFEDDLPVLVAEPVRFGLEVRAFVLDRRICSLSAYIRGGEIAKAADGSWPLAEEEEAQARALLETLLADAAVAMPPAVVVDVGCIEGRGWAVVEANPAWAAGLCGCDPTQVLPVLRRATVAGEAATAEDRRWARQVGA
jgi:hypothetical protein